LRTTPHLTPPPLSCAGNGSGDVASKAQQLLEHSLLSELRAVVARALSGLEMFGGSQLTEMDLLAPENFDKEVSEFRGVSICLRT